MATIKPFKAVRPNENFEADISALPYDVYSRKEAKEYVSDKPLSFLNIDRPETQFGDDFDMYSKESYEMGLKLYESFKSDGKFIKEKKDMFYLYEQTMLGRSQTGLVCTASVFEYEENIIKKHENTRADKELDRINHVNTLNAQTGPIFLAYKDVESLNSLFFKIKTETAPYFDFVSDDGIRHKGWKIENAIDINTIIDDFKSVKNLYIADGHHRCASAAKVSKLRRENNTATEESNFFLSVIFPESELMIMDYNRVVKDLNGLSTGEFLDKISERFVVSKLEVSDNKPANKGDIYMFLEDKEYLIRLKDEFIQNDPINSLDVSVLQNHLLGPVLGINDPKTDKRIDFVGGIRGVKELRRRLNVDSKVAFSMYPTLMKELFAIADAGLLMPPKSTWFEPKLRSGLFIHELV